MEALLDRGEHWHQLVSIIQPFLSGSDAAFCQINLTSLVVVVVVVVVVLLHVC